MKYGLLLSCLSITLPLLAHMAMGFDENPPGYGAEANPTGDPIGGGKGYRGIVRSGNHPVANAKELLAALKVAKAGEVVYVAPNAEIDLTGNIGISIPDGVTLAGNRGDDSPGPLLFTKELPKSRALFHAGAGTHVTGLRIKGPDCNFAEIDYDKVPRSWAMAIMARASDVEVDNCEISNFHHSGVGVQGKDIHIHHNFIHDIHAYPVCVGDKAEPPTLIEANLIHWVWHTIAGTGAPGTGYEARFNLCVRKPPPASWGKDHKSHGFDMHAYRPVQKATRRLIAGDVILIHHNTMIDNGPALGVRIRGIPREICRVYRNWFSEPDPALGVEQLTPLGNVWVYDNAYGPEKTVVPVVPPTTPQIRFKQPPPGAEPTVVKGKVAVDIEVNALEPMKVRRVVIQLGEREIYSGDNAPPPGEVVIDTQALGPGDHILSVTATDDRGAEAKHATTIRVAD